MTPPGHAPHQEGAAAPPQTSKAEPKAYEPAPALPNSVRTLMLTDGGQVQSPPHNTVLEQSGAPVAQPQRTDAAPQPSTGVAGKIDGVPITVVVDEDVDGPEFCIRAIMKTFGESHKEAEARIVADGWTFHGWYSKNGVHGKSLSQPIIFWARMSPRYEVQRKEIEQRPTPIDPASRGAIDKGVDQQLTAEEQSALDDSRPPSMMPALVQSAMNSGYLRSFIRIGTQKALLQLPEQPTTDDYQAVLAVHRTLLLLSPEDLDSYWKIWMAGRPLHSWTETATSLTEFTEARAALREPIDLASVGRLAGTEHVYALIKEYEDLEKKPQRVYHGESFENPRKREVLAARDKALGEADFDSVAAFDAAAEEYRVYFRTLAVALLEHSLQASQRTLLDAISRFQIRDAPNVTLATQVPRACQELYDEFLNARSQDTLTNSHPILRGTGIWAEISKASNVFEFSGRLTRYAQQHLSDVDFVQELVRKDQDMVFKLDVIVDAIMDRFGLDPSSVHRDIIRDQRGKADHSNSLLRTWVDRALLVLSFVPGPIGVTAAVVSAGLNINDAGTDFGLNMSAYGAGAVREKPSAMPILYAGLELAAPPAVIGATSVVIRRGARLIRAIRATTKAESFAIKAGKEELAIVNRATKPELAATGGESVPTVETIKSYIKNKALLGAKSGMKPDKLPTDYKLLLRLLEEHAAEPGVAEFANSVPVVMDALRNPEYYGEVMAEAWARSTANNTNLTTELLAMAKESGLTVKETQKAVEDADVFYKQYASEAVAIHDVHLPVDKAHGQMTHIIQDLVVDKGLRAAAEAGSKLPKSSGEFRTLLKTLVTDVKFPDRLANEFSPPMIDMTLGEAVWRGTYDLLDRKHHPTPEATWPRLKAAMKWLMKTKDDLLK
jgi:hypothetical protein